MYTWALICGFVKCMSHLVFFFSFYVDVSTAVTLAIYFDHNALEIHFNSWAAHLNVYELCLDLRKWVFSRLNGLPFISELVQMTWLTEKRRNSCHLRVWSLYLHSLVLCHHLTDMENTGLACRFQLGPLNHRPVKRKRRDPSKGIVYCISGVYLQGTSAI